MLYILQFYNVYNIGKIYSYITKLFTWCTHNILISYFMQVLLQFLIMKYYFNHTSTPKLFQDFSYHTILST